MLVDVGSTPLAHRGLPVGDHALQCDGAAEALPGPGLEHPRPSPGDAKRLKELEVENARLKTLLAEAELDKAMLKEITGKF